jgi:hypothetical protein
MEVHARQFAAGVGGPVPLRAAAASSAPQPRQRAVAVNAGTAHGGGGVATSPADLGAGPHHALLAAAATGRLRGVRLPVAASTSAATMLETLLVTVAAHHQPLPAPGVAGRTQPLPLACGRPTRSQVAQAATWPLLLMPAAGHRPYVHPPGTDRGFRTRTPARLHLLENSRPLLDDAGRGISQQQLARLTREHVTDHVQIVQPHRDPNYITVTGEPRRGGLQVTTVGLYMLWLRRDPVGGPTTRGAGTSCSPGSRITPSAWTTSSGCGGRRGSSARTAAQAGGGWPRATGRLRAVTVGCR